MLWNENSYVETMLDDIDVVMSIGICEHEKTTPQNVSVSVKLFQQLDKLNAEKIGDCLNYALIHDFVAGWRNRPHVDLIETLIEDLIEKCLEDRRVDACWVSIRKPDIFDDTKAVGIRAYRKREDHDK